MTRAVLTADAKASQAQGLTLSQNSSRRLSCLLFRAGMAGTGMRVTH